MGYRVHPARAADSTVLLELAAHLRKTLGRRGENLPAAWPDELVEDLRAGRLEGLLLEGAEGPVGLGILSLRARRAFAQVHLMGATEPVEAVERLMEALLDPIPESVVRVDFGVSGLTGEEEAALGLRVAKRPGFETIRRFGLVRSLSLSEEMASVRLPEGFRFHPIGDIPVPELGRVDWEAFRDGPDAAFVADSPEENLLLLEKIRAGQLGMFLEAASTGVADSDGHLAAFTLVVEESARVGVFVDIAVLPAARHHGLGEGMVRYGFRALMALGYERVRLWVTEANAPALRLYLRLGFQKETLSYIFRYRRGTGAEGPSPQTAR
ncbi:MAG: GNAT family N-acetyltransferase [Thermoplasmata archaeon]